MKKHASMGTGKKSMSQGTATGSGSRPSGGKTMTPTSSPKGAEMHGLGRKPPGALK